MFHCDAAAIDAHIDKQLKRQPRYAAGWPDIDSAGPGFRLDEVFLDRVTDEGGPIYTAIAQFVYMLFCQGGARAYGPHRISGKPVILTQARRFPVEGKAFLAVRAGHGHILVPMPEVSGQLLTSDRHRTVGESRAAVLESARACVDRVNLVWPAAVALQP